MINPNLIPLPKPSATLVALAKFAKPRPLRTQNNPKRTICDDDVADRVYKHLKNRIDSDTVVVDIQAGLGLLSQRLIDSPARCVRALETNAELRNWLEVLSTFREEGRYLTDKRELYSMYSADRSILTSRWLYEDGKPGTAKKVLVTGSLVGSRMEPFSAIANHMLEGGVLFPRSVDPSLVVLVREKDVKTFLEPGKFFVRKTTLFNTVVNCKVLETFRESDLHPYYGSDGDYNLVEITRNDLGLRTEDAEDLSSFLHLVYGRPSQSIRKALGMVGSGAESLLSQFPPDLGDSPVRTVPPNTLFQLFQAFIAWPDRPALHHEAMTTTYKGLKVKKS